MSEEWWTCRCVRVARDVVDAEIARLVATIAPDAAVFVDREGDLVQIAIQNDDAVCDEVAHSLGGLVWFQHGNTSEDVDITSLHCDGVRLFQIVRCALLSIDQVTIAPGAFGLVPTSLADVLDPAAWIMRLATERYGEDFTRISGDDIRSGNQQEIAGTGPERPPRVPTTDVDVTPSVRERDETESDLPDDIPF